MECYNISVEPKDKNPWDIYIPESKGNQALEGPSISYNEFLKLLKIEKVNIGSPENPKLSNIGDY